MLENKILENTTVVILAGGRGTRLSSRTSGMPKPMANLLNYSIIEHQIRFAASQGFKYFKVIASYKANLLEEHIKKIQLPNICVEVETEDEPRGTGGALLTFAASYREFVIVLYGDTYITVDLIQVLLKTQEVSKGRNFLGAILVHPNSHPQDSDLVKIDQNNKVTQVFGYPHDQDFVSRNLVNAALYVFSKTKLAEIKSEINLPRKFDIAKDFFPKVISANYDLIAIKNTWFIKDLGTPERLDSVEAFIREGKINNFAENFPKSVVFLDRDGCINEEVGYITDPTQLKLINGASAAIKNFNHAGLPVICVTNQPIIARGDATPKDLERIHTKLDFDLGIDGAYLNDLYYCPHHPDSGFKGEVKELKYKCSCRKPATGMVLSAMSRYSIDLSNSWMIGDSTVDIKLAENLGLSSILLRTGHAGLDGKEYCYPDFIFDDLFEASNFISDFYPKLRRLVLENYSKFIENKVVYIGGLSRAGKSTVAQCIAKVLNVNGISTKVIPADNWLNPSKLRDSAKNVLQRYDLLAMEVFLENILATNGPLYGAKTMRNTDNISTIKLPYQIFPNDTVIVEGCPVSLLSPGLLENGLFIWVEVNEEVRTKRSFNKYLSLNIELEDIKIKLQDRILDEDKLIDASQTKSQLYWSL